MRNRASKVKRLSFNKRIELKRSKGERVKEFLIGRKKFGNNEDDEKIEEFVREYFGLIDLVSLDWKKMKILFVFLFFDYVWLFKLVEFMKVYIFVFYSYFYVVWYIEI